MEYSENQILSLISHIHSKAQELSKKGLTDCADSDLASSHGHILFLLGEYKSLTFSEITDKISRNKSTTTALIKKLVAEDFVKVETDKVDSRIKKISLTKKGRLFNKKANEISETLLSTAWKDFTAKEKSQLLSLLIKINDNLQDA